jgi:hypothetical protein
VRDWECSELYCPYYGDVCVPPDTIHATGDRLGYEEPDGSIPYCPKWLSNVPGFASVGSAQGIEKPRGKDEAE